MKKKIISALLCILVVVSLAGCGKAKNVDKSAASKDTNSSIKNTEASKEEAGNSDNITEKDIVSVGDFEIIPKKGMLLHYNGNETNIEIPSEIGGVKIVSITGFDCKQNLEKVVIPEGVTSISEGAFINCTSLKSIVIPNSVTDIGKIAFCTCQELENIKLPSSLKTIGERAFDGCSKLKSIEIPDSVKSIGESAFITCNSLKSVVLPKGITYIKKETFSSSGIENITIPESVTNIEEKAFNNCRHLANVTLTSSSTNIESNSFSETQKTIFNVINKEQKDQLIRLCPAQVTGSNIHVK